MHSAIGSIDPNIQTFQAIRIGQLHVIRLWFDRSPTCVKHRGTLLGYFVQLHIYVALVTASSMDSKGFFSHELWARGRCMVSFKNQTLRYDSTQETQYNHICHIYNHCMAKHANIPIHGQPKQLMKLIQRLMAWGGLWRGDLWVNPWYYSFKYWLRK